MEAACQLLVDGGAVEPRYLSRCIEMVEEHGPYMVLAPGIALAHARPEDGAIRLGLSAVTLANPVEFGHPDNDPVDLVVCFASPDQEQHVGLLGALARGFVNGLDRRLRAASTADDAAGLLQEVVADVRHTA